MTASAKALLFAACLLGINVTDAAARVTTDGSSTVYPIVQQAAWAFHRAIGAKSVVTVGISGTGGGFRKFCNGQIDVANASRPILAAEMKVCSANGIEFVELPIAFDAITVVANPRNTFLRELTLEQLRRLWIPEAQGLVRTWQQLDPAWPNEPIRLFGPGRDSGTFDYFTEAVVGKSGTSRTDYVASEDDHVLVQGVLREPGALGYFGFSYYLENQARLRAVAIADTGRPAVAPSRDTILSGAYRPLSRPLFVYVAVRALDREDVRQFVELLVAEGARFAREAKYVPLPANAYPIVQAHLRERRVGTIFNGALAIGITIQELLRREIQR